ncbi:MAG: DUF1127 domain-containing protein, partial [Alphaproteobacteria bacterium]|nr:DUF1127 domain-containing protein [Alphaproteobacteria bacterium]
ITTALHEERFLSTHRPASRPRGVAVNLFASVVGAWRRVREIRATRRALNRLDNHLLCDIGVRRDQIGPIARAVSLPYLTVSGQSFDHTPWRCD